MGVTKGKTNGLSIASQLMNLADDELRHQVMAELEQTDPELKTRLRDKLVRFEDLATLSDHDVRVMLKNTDTSYWAPATSNMHLSTCIKKLLVTCMPVQRMF
ncbi:MAG: FliG C-terminal domain-containing protein [Pirellulaceae bacterium]